MPMDMVSCPLGMVPGGLALTSTTPGQICQPGLLPHTIMETNNNTIEKTPLIIKINPAPPQVSLYGGQGKRGPSGPIVTTSDEEESQDSPRGKPGSNTKDTEAEPPTFSPSFLDHDYENVSSPGNSSTASGPTYVRQPGFTHHAHEVSKPKVKKKKTAPLGAMKDGLRRREPTPPKNKPKRDPLPMRMRALPQSFWQQPNVANNVSPAVTYPILPPLFQKDEDGDMPEERPMTPPSEEKSEKEKVHKSHRKITVANTDLLFKLFEGIEKESKKPPSSGPPKDQLKRGRPRKVVPVTSNKTLVTGEDPYMVDSMSDKLFPQLRLEQSTKGSQGGALGGGSSTLHVITLKEGDRSVTLPALSVENNYPQMLSELVAHI